MSHFGKEGSGSHKLDFFKTELNHIVLRQNENNYQFTFLNSTVGFDDAINWNDQTQGKLWNYNLQYLDVLKQDNLPISVKLDLVLSLYAWLNDGRLPLEPYPASLRIMNVIRFLESTEVNLKDAIRIKQYLWAEINYLSQNLEYHILANHLLENAFAFWMGGLYFQNDSWLKKSAKLLEKELEEQVLLDGAHFELAPMYHQIILFRVLEAYCLSPESHPMKVLLKEKAELMLTWLIEMTLPNGTLPHFNDTTESIAISSSELQNIANNLNILPKKNLKLSLSGYRRLKLDNLVLIADIEGIKPSYQPGHAHADTFSFVLHQGENPIIVDPGISTYTISEKRNWERSTAAHNTIEINGKSSSEVWSGFRVGKRAKVTINADEGDRVSAEHNGYSPIKHTREFLKKNENIEILDILSGRKSKHPSVFRLHFHPDCKIIQLDASTVKINESILIQWNCDGKIEIENYQFAEGFNLLTQATRLSIKFLGSQIRTIISPIQ